MTKREQWMDDLLTGDELPRRIPTKYEQELQNDRFDKPVTIFGVVVGSVCIIVARYDEWNPKLVVAGIVCFGLLLIRAYAGMKVNTVFANQREDELAFARAMYAQRIIQRPGLIASLNNVEIEKYRALGVLNASELAYAQEERKMKLTSEEAAKVRAWQSGEAKEARQQSTDELLAKHRHELTILEKRVRSAPDVTKDELAAFELEKAAMDAIEKENDPDKKERMIRRLDKRLYR